jgi:hypothetical protein
MRIFVCLQIVWAVFLVLPVAGQIQTANDSIAFADTVYSDFRLFGTSDMLEISLRFDMTQFTRVRSKDEYMKVLVTFYFSEEDSINLEAKLKSRGEFRHDYCTFPPISLNFKRDSLARGDLSRLDKVKMVTHCKIGNEDYLFKEYLTYRLYNILTDNSLRVRLLKVNYINTFKESKSIQSYGFFIEPLDLLAERTQSVPEDSPYLTTRNIRSDIMDRVAVFNYMIGNTDWSVAGQHNCKILNMPDSVGQLMRMAVPYDFDYSGIVNAPYAIPADGLGLTSVRQRLYLGLCSTEEDMLKIVKEFADKKDEFYNEIRKFPLLHEWQRKNMIAYLDEFYRGFDNKNSIIHTLLLNCRNR